MPEQPFRQVRWFQLAAQVSGQLCSLWLPSRELPADFPSALAQLLRRVRWFQLSAAAFQLAAQVLGRLCSL